MTGTVVKITKRYEMPRARCNTHVETKLDGGGITISDCMQEAEIGDKCYRCAYENLLKEIADLQSQLDEAQERNKQLLKDNQELSVIMNTVKETVFEKIAEVRMLQVQRDKLKNVFGQNQPWSLLTCAKGLIVAVTHLFSSHNCDIHCQNHEEWLISVKQMRKYIKEIEEVLK